ncbi:MAG: NlpC/P60 family protein [Actinomycetota bacterium]|nr:NlpC/P60 family protein [Actinomycetota bacterium]
MRLERAGIAAVCAMALSTGMFTFSTAAADPKVTPKDVENSFHKVEAVVENVNRLKTEIASTQSEIKDLNEDIARDEKSYDAQKETLSAAIVSQQMDAPLGPTVNLLGSENPEAFLDGLGAVQALNSSRADALEKFGATSKELKNRRAQLKDRNDDLLADQKSAKAKQAEIRKKYNEAKAELAKLTAAEQTAFNSSNLDLGFEVDASGRAKQALDFALGQLGDPYSYGGTGPNSWDCSGLMMKSYAAAGASIPRVVGPQYNAVKHVSMSELQPGDLVFYGDMSHNGMYVGRGKVVHAPRPGKSVEITSLSGFSKAGRVG